MLSCDHLVPLLNPHTQIPILIMTFKYFLSLIELCLTGIYTNVPLTEPLSLKLKKKLFFLFYLDVIYF